MTDDGRHRTFRPLIFVIPHVRPETWVTLRTGHMGNTFRLWAGGVDAVESEFGNGRAPLLCRPAAGRRGHDGHVPGVRDIPQDRLQDIRPLQGARARSPD